MKIDNTIGQIGQTLPEQAAPMNNQATAWKLGETKGDAKSLKDDIFSDAMQYGRAKGNVSMGEFKADYVSGLVANGVGQQDAQKLMDDFFTQENVNDSLDLRNIFSPEAQKEIPLPVGSTTKFGPLTAPDKGGEIEYDAYGERVDTGIKPIDNQQAAWQLGSEGISEKIFQTMDSDRLKFASTKPSSPTAGQIGRDADEGFKPAYRAGLIKNGVSAADADKLLKGYEDRNVAKGFDSLKSLQGDINIKQSTSSPTAGENTNPKSSSDMSNEDFNRLMGNK